MRKAVYLAAQKSPKYLIDNGGFLGEIVEASDALVAALLDMIKQQPQELVAVLLLPPGHVARDVTQTAQNLHGSHNMAGPRQRAFNVVADLTTRAKTYLSLPAKSKKGVFVFF